MTCEIVFTPGQLLNYTHIKKLLKYSPLIFRLTTIFVYINIIVSTCLHTADKMPHSGMIFLLSYVITNDELCFQPAIHSRLFSTVLKPDHLSDLQRAIVRSLYFFWCLI